MRPKKFLVSAINSNSVKVYDAVSQQLHRIIHIEGTINSQPISNGSTMEVIVLKEQAQYKQVYALPNGNIISSTVV
jgi:hypothetical protein